MRRFFSDLAGNSINKYYYYQTAIANNWYHINEGPNITTWWSISYLRYWGFCWNNCTIKAANSDIEDIFDQNATPELCSWFACNWANGRWYAWVTAREREVVIHTENFSQPAYAKPELLAMRPNEVWSWDITKLKGPAKWTCFHLYVQAR